MMDSVLVANRGEIACRIFRTARRMGMRTIAVYSDADATALHVRQADAAIHIGGAAPRDSYLNSARLIEAAQASGARAIHPGYGFLAENAQFAARCEQAGLCFIGPPAAAIAAMGSKSLAKARMRAAGVPVLPGYEGAEQDLAYLERAARGLPLPLMIKPAAGGGGKGMCIVRNEAQIAAALLAARRLAASAFGDGTLLLERFLEAPRHVEVQIFADTHGRCVHLGDRDCSIQRRHQKLIEEAPAPQIPPDTREHMRAAAVLVAREVGYVGAGTVEFLFDSGQFYFMEMNTRLQVEHTVTEAVTGLDLVEWQFRVADGQPLPLEQSQITLIGHALEARVCAEDPQRDFLPSAGRLRLLQWPLGDGLRVDAGFASGDEVPASYDSLLGKVIAWAPTREQAAARLAQALQSTYSAGVRTNERWLARVVRDAQFLAVQHSVVFLQSHAATFADPGAADVRALVIAALCAHRACNAAGESSTPVRPRSPWEQRDGFRPGLGAQVQIALGWNQHSYWVQLGFIHGEPAAAEVGRYDAPADQQFSLADVSFTATSVSVRIGTSLLRSRYLLDGSQLHVWLDADHFDFVLDDPRDREYCAAAMTGGLTTPLPGVVATVAVTVGQGVAEGDLLMVVEAMKMEHSILAPHGGTVKAILCATGDRVAQGQALLELTPTAAMTAGN